MPNLDAVNPDGEGLETGCCQGDCDNCTNDNNCPSSESDQDSDETEE